jgi:hypothetical protein
MDPPATVKFPKVPPSHLGDEKSLPLMPTEPVAIAPSIQPWSETTAKEKR